MNEGFYGFPEGGSQIVGYEAVPVSGPSLNVIPHGLRVVPRHAVPFLLCVSPEQGWEAGDKVYTILASDGVVISQPTVIRTAANVTVMIVGSVQIQNKTTAVRVQIVEAKWRLQVYLES